MSTKANPANPDPAEKTFANQAPTNIPHEEAKVGVGANRQPDLEDYEGLYLRKSDGEKYALAVVPEDTLGRTHKATNTLHFWEGSEAQFRESFTNEDGSRINEDKPSTHKKKK